MTADPPKYRPLERFWPYAELPEQPTAAELAALDPDLYEALFGAQKRPFSITLVFPALEVPGFAHALELARGSAEFKRTRPPRTTDPATEGSGPAIPGQERRDEGFAGFPEHPVAGEDYVGDDLSGSGTVDEREPEPANA